MRATLFAYVIHGAAAGTCANLKTVYEDEKCCGNPGKTIKFPFVNASSCPYSFATLLCTDAGPQSPKDLTSAVLATSSHGTRNPQAPIFTHDQMNKMTITNVHFHLGAEHKSDNYASDAYTTDWAGSMTGGPYGYENHPVRPGWFGTSGTVAGRAAEDDVGEPCVGMKIHDTIETHFVHSSAGKKQADDGDYMLIDDGLLTAVNGRGLRNPYVHVEAVVYEILSDTEAASDAAAFTPTGSLLETPWPSSPGETEYVRYVGSSTGESYDGNTVEADAKCSPFIINWGVDLRLHKVSATTMQNFCALMASNGLKKDVKVHGSRELLNSAYVTTKFSVGLNNTRILNSMAELTQTTTTEAAPTTTTVP